MTHLRTISSLEWSSTPTSLASTPSSFPTADGDRALWILRTYGDMQIHATLHLQGRIQPERLARAVRLTLDIEPILGCYYRDRWWRSTWHRHTNLDELPLCSLEETDNLNASLQAFLIEEYLPTQDPLVHVRILRGEHDTLCFKVNHILADAGGTKQLLYLIASLYNQLLQTPNLQVTPRLTGNRNISQLVPLLGWKRALPSIWRGFVDLFHRVVPFRCWNLPCRSGPSTERKYIFCHIRPPQWQAIKMFSRKHNVTLNDVLMAAYLRALDKVFDIPAAHPMRAMNTVDLRRYAPHQELDRICNFSNFTHPSFPRNKDESFLQTLEKMSTYMNRIKADHIGLGDTHLMASIFRVFPTAWVNRAAHFFFHNIGKKWVHPTLTNMGVIDSHRVKFDDCPLQNAYLSASVLYPPIFVAGLSGCAEQLTLSAGFCESSISATTISELFHQTLLELPNEQ